VSELPTVSDAPCPNCGSRLLGRFCADCGQAAPRVGDYSLRTHVAEFFDQTLSFDGKVVRTLWTLVSKPGVLTADHLRGRRVPYLKPLQLFLVVNVLFFVAAPKMPMFNYSLGNYLAFSPPSPALVAGLVQREAGSADAYVAYVKKFDERVESERKSLIVLFAPALALVLSVLFAWRIKRPDVPSHYGEHLVFALHLLTFIWLALAGWGMIIALMAGRAPSRAGVVAVGIVAVLLLGAVAHAFLAVRRVYDLSVLRSLAVVTALALGFVGILVAYRTLLFFTTYYTL